MAKKRVIKVYQTKQPRSNPPNRVLYIILGFVGVMMSIVLVLLFLQF